MDNVAALKKIASDLGFEMWWDRGLQLWTITKDGVHTEYFPSAVIRQIHHGVFEMILREKP